MLGAMCYTNSTIEGLSDTFNQYESEQDDLEVKLWNLGKSDGSNFNGENLPSQKNNIDPRNTRVAHTHLYKENEWNSDKKNKVQFVRISRNGGNRKIEKLNWWSGQGREPGGWYILGTNDAYNSKEDLINNVYGKGSNIGNIENTDKNNRNNFNIDVPSQYHNSRYIYLYLNHHYSYGGWLFRISAKGDENLSDCQYRNWSDCDKPCGGGTQTRDVLNNPCKPIGDHTQKNCNTQACKYETGVWGPCTNTCGGGTQTRTVQCTDGNGIGISEDYCNSLTTPANSQECNTAYCEYKTGLWSSCSTNCGGGTQTRPVSCVDKNGESIDEKYCNTNNKPAKSKPCNLKPCPESTTAASTTAASTTAASTTAASTTAASTTAASTTAASTTAASEVGQTECHFYTLKDSNGNYVKVADRDPITQQATSDYIDVGGGLMRTYYYNKVLDKDGKRVHPNEVPTKCSNYETDIQLNGHSYPSRSEADRLAENAGIGDPTRDSKSYLGEIKSYLEELRVGPERMAIGDARNRWSSETDMFAGLKLKTAEKCYKRDENGAFILQAECSSDIGPIAANEVLGDSFGTGGP